MPEKFSSTYPPPDGFQLLELPEEAAVGVGPVETLSLLDAASALREWVEIVLRERGAVLLRGFSRSSAKDFTSFVRTLSGEPLDYRGGNSPRTTVDTGLYTSTEYPAALPISLHNELSYEPVWPKRLHFLCDTAPTSGGETPLGDSRKILEAMPSDLLDRWSSQGLQYRRTLHSGFGLGRSWQDTFETDDRSVVEGHLRRIGTAFEWTPDDLLKTWHVCPAIRDHPVTGDAVWFNQADQWHPSALDEQSRLDLLDICGPENLPLDVRFADGRIIPDDDIAAISSVVESCIRKFPWKAEDILVIDNMLVAHGRMPYEGDRKVLVSLT